MPHSIRPVFRGGLIGDSFPGVNPLQLLGTPAFPFQNKNCIYGNGQQFPCTRAILGKLDSQGKVIWSSVIGRDDRFSPSGVYGLSIDSSGNIYAAISNFFNVINNFALVKIEPVGPAPLL